MTLSLRQWTVVLVLISGFAVAAFVVSRGGDSGLPPIDTALWCSGAEGLAGAGDLFSGDAADVTAADVEVVKATIFDVEVTAPYELRNGLARLADFAIVLDQQLTDLGWPAAFDSARGQVDTAPVDQALVDLETAMRLCGVELFS